MRDVQNAHDPVGGVDRPGARASRAAGPHAPAGGRWAGPRVARSAVRPVHSMVAAIYRELDATVPLDAIGCTLPLRAVHERVEFTTEPSRAPHL